MFKKLLSMLGLGGKPAAAEKPVTMEALQGTWLMVSCGKNGNFAPPQMIQMANIRMTIRGDRYAITQSGNPSDSGTLRVDASQSPVTFDHHVLAGDDAGKVHLGLVRFVGDELENCQGDIGCRRPKDFNPQRHDGASLARFRRVSG
jgi:uncharacterized protein (TIGR03067 family)